VYAFAVEYQVSAKKHRLDENIASYGEIMKRQWDVKNTVLLDSLQRTGGWNGY